MTSHGIPHLHADTLDDLARAQGREVAASRAWQVEVARRRGEGRLAELVGPAGLDWDVFARRALVPEVARRAYDALEEETRSFVTAYVDGVNETVATDPGHPEPWQPWTPLGIFLAQHILFATFPDKLWRRTLSAAAGDAVVEALLAGPGPASGSNALGLTGERTTSGLPLVTGDPHRTFEAPNGYVQVRLTTPDLDVTGFTFPGVPGVQHFAQAETVAWGITNAIADYQDLFLEHLERRGDEVWAAGPDGPARCDVRREQVLVRDAVPVAVEVMVTERGPVIHGAVGADEVLSLRTPSYVLGELGFDAIPRLLRARTTGDVVAAYGHWVEPVNNLVVADSTGDLRHQVVGRVPQRTFSRVPVPATDPSYAWSGWVDLPATTPVDGAVVTANDRVVDDWLRVGQDFAAPFRAARIRDRLGERDRWSADDVHEVLLDTRQTAGSVLLTLVGSAEGLSDAGLALQAELAGWDREMLADSETAAAYVAVRDALVASIVALPMFAGVRDAAPYGGLYDAWFNPALRVATGLHTFLARAGDLGVDVVPLVGAALEAAATAPRTTWGERHRFAPYTPLTMVGLDDEPVAVAGSPLSGDSDCARCTGWLPGTDRSTRGSVARYVWDLADRGSSRWAVPLGAGAHDTDQFEAWRSGAMLPVTGPWES
ncbi:MAG: hypothetical protein JWO46_514 [Nocardioidaceae bacterium]|nr:hypothetical protein [Nocardioidaceae bacterium]